MERQSLAPLLALKCPRRSALIISRRGIPEEMGTKAHLAVLVELPLLWQVTHGLTWRQGQIVCSYILIYAVIYADVMTILQPLEASGCLPHHMVYGVYELLVLSSHWKA